MAKIFETNFQKGSLVETCTGNVATLTTAQLQRTEKGLALNCLPGYSAYTISNTLVGDLTIVISFRVRSTGNNAFGRMFGNDQFYTYFNNSLSTFYITSNDRSISALLTTNIKKDRWYNMIITRSSSGTYYSYLNGTYDTTGNSGTPIAGSTTFWVGAGETTSNYANGFISYCAIYNHIFTEKERADAYKDFLNSYPIISEKYPQAGIVNKPMDLSKEKENTYVDFYWSNFGAGVDSFSAVSGSSIDGNIDGISSEDNTLRVTASAATARIRRSLTQTVGQKVRFSYRYYKPSSSTINRIQWTGYTGSGNFGDNTSLVSDVWTYYSTIQTIDADRSSGINCYCYNAAVGDLIYFKDIRVENICGLVAAYNFIPNGNTLVDISGNGYNITDANTRMKDGILYKGNKYSSISPTINLGTIHTINLRVRFDSTSTNQVILTNGTYYLRKSNSTTLTYYTGNTITITIPDTTNRVVSLTFIRNGLDLSVYIDGVYIGAGNNVNTNNFQISIVGGLTSISQMFYGQLFDMRFYNRVLTLNEIKAYHNSFVNPTLTIDFKDEGADGVSKVPSGWIKQSGSFKIDEYQCALGEKIVNGSFTTDTDWTKSSGSWTITGGKANYDDINDSVYITPNVGVAFTVGKTYRLRYKISNLASGTASLVFVNQTSSVCFTEYSTYQTRANGTYDEVIHCISTATNLRIRASIASTGSWSIDDISIQEIPPLPTFTNGTKYLEDVVYGTIALPSKQSYGTWEFDFYQAASSNDTYIPFISNNKGTYTSSLGYVLRFARTGVASIVLYRSTIGGGVQLGATSVGYLTYSTWYRIRITRTLAGVFNVLIKGGNLTPTAGYDGWTFLFTVTDTTYTISEYFVLNTSTTAGNKIANINILDGIKQY